MYRNHRLIADEKVPPYMTRDLGQLRDRYQRFVSERDWDRFHTPQNLAMAISVESNELVEKFLWFGNPSSEEIREDEELLSEIREEMADVMIYLLGLANQLDIDLLRAVEEKMDQNDERFDSGTSEEFSAYLDEWQ